MPTVFFAASRDELALVAAGAASGLGPAGELEGLDTVAAGDLDPAQLIDLDMLVTGHDPAEVREAVLTPAHEEEPDDGSGGTVLLPVRNALGSRLAHLSDHDIDALAESWSAADGAADVDWDAYRCGQLIRSLSLLSLLAQAEHRDLYVRFDS